MTPWALSKFHLPGVRGRWVHQGHRHFDALHAMAQTHAASANMTPTLFTASGHVIG